MSNKLILWSSLLLPWLTLFLMKKDEIRRFLPVGMFAALTSIIFVDIGSTLNLWTLKENIYPFSKLFPYHLGAGPIATMWLFKFTYKRFWRYVSIDVIYNLIFSYLLIPWLAFRGIRENVNATNFSLFLIVTLQGLILYVYQTILDGVSVCLGAFNLNPVAAKPYINKGNKDKDDQS